MNIHRFLMLGVIGCVIASGLLIVLQMWFDLFDEIILMKLLGTMGIFAIISGLVLVLRMDLQQNKKLKDQNYLD